MENVKNWIETWLLLYPPDIKYGRESLRSKPQDCVSKMQKFVKTYPQYTKDVIFAATNMYLQERARENWAYTKYARYFIDKQGAPSLLAKYCEDVIQGNTPKAHELIQEYSPIDDFI